MEFPPPVNGTEQRLDAILAELRAQNQQEPKPTTGEVELQEPARPQRARRARGDSDR